MMDEHKIDKVSFNNLVECFVILANSYNGMGGHKEEMFGMYIFVGFVCVIVTLNYVLSSTAKFRLPLMLILALFFFPSATDVAYKYVMDSLEDTSVCVDILPTDEGHSFQFNLKALPENCRNVVTTKSCFQVMGTENDYSINYYMNLRSKTCPHVVFNNGEFAFKNEPIEIRETLTKNKWFNPYFYFLYTFPLLVLQVVVVYRAHSNKRNPTGTETGPPP